MIRHHVKHLATLRSLALLPIVLFGMASIISFGGCGGSGGGSGGGGGGSGDMTAPTVSSTTPADNSIGVSRGASMMATFSEPILASSIDGSSFTLRDSRGFVAASVSYDSSTDAATLTPNQLLTVLTPHTAALSTGITDVAGNALASEVSWSFTTGDGQWATPELAETDDADDATEPEIAFDANGDALAVWNQSDGTRFNIWSNRYVAGMGWATAELIETDNAGHAQGPKVAVDANGNAVAVWQHFDGFRSNVWSNRYAVGVGWGTAELIETDDAGSVQRPQIAVDANGNALAVWQQEDSTRSNIWANRYTVGMGWGAPELIETGNAGGAFNAHIAVDASGNALAVWQQDDGTRHNIWANRYTASSGWGSAELIETENAGNAQAPKIAFDANGNALAGWQQFNASILNTWANLYTAGSGWGTAELIETSAGFSQTPKIAFDANGDALAVWHQDDGTHLSVWSNRFTAGSGWGTAELIETDNAGDVFSTAIAVQASGNALAVWHQDDGMRKHIWSNRYIAGVGWGTPELIETDDVGDATRPKVAIDASGSALAVWHQDDGTRNNVWSNRFE